MSLESAFHGVCKDFLNEHVILHALVPLLGFPAGTPCASLGSAGGFSARSAEGAWRKKGETEEQSGTALREHLHALPEKNVTYYNNNRGEG